MFKLALCQISGSDNKDMNIAKADRYIREAAAEGAQVISIPEMWNCPYSNEYFRKYAEPAHGRSVTFMKDVAAELGIYLIGGTIPELEGPEESSDGQEHVYNTCFCFGPDGGIIGKHRKVHLFDIDVKGKFRFMESETLTAGDDMTVIDTEYCKIGVAVCYDVRFPDWFMKMALAGAQLIVLPAAFNTTTGPVHWDVTMQARAVDNQLYIAANAPARDEKGIFKAYGHSCIVDPWAQFVAKAGAQECIIYGDIDPEKVSSIRQQLPLLKHRRPELY
ncbi:MAG: carbon-nitrogen hydrolase family protein [Eubacteriales bacterium]|nr:carbon-nitrogen hydrolase family protein [Eubacteriales bacterium]